MKLKNTYNILDQFVAYLRDREVKKNNNFKNKSILDFGCGSNFDQITKRYKDATEIVLIDRVGKNFTKKNLKFINYKNNIKNLDKLINNKKFDIIILSAVIEHLEYPEKVLKYLKKFLNPSGYFFLTAPSKKSKFLIEFLAFRLKIINAELAKEHKRYYDLHEYKKLSKKSCCKILKFYFFELGMNTIAILK